MSHFPWDISGYKWGKRKGGEDSLQYLLDSSYHVSSVNCLMYIQSPVILPKC